MNNDGFDSSNGFKCSDLHSFEKLNNSANNIFELYCYQDQNIWKHKLIPIEVSKNDSDSVVDLLIYKNHYVLIKKLHILLGKHDCILVCREILSSCTSQNVLMKHRERYAQQEIRINRNSNDIRLYWKKHFQKHPLYFRIYADFEAEIEIENTSIDNRTTNTLKQSPVCTVCNGYRIGHELSDVLKSGYYETHFI